MLRHTVSFFFNDTATTEIYTLSLHDALPICPRRACSAPRTCRRSSSSAARGPARPRWSDRKSTRLNSSHVRISYAVFCLKSLTRVSGGADRDRPGPHRPAGDRAHVRGAGRGLLRALGFRLEPPPHRAALRRPPHDALPLCATTLG